MILKRKTLNDLNVKELVEKHGYQVRLSRADHVLECFALEATPIPQEPNYFSFETGSGHCLHMSPFMP